MIKSMLLVLLLPSAKDNRCFHVPTLKKTNLDPDNYFLRLAKTLKIDLISSLDFFVSAISFVKIWIEKIEEFGLKKFLKDD